MTDMAGLRPGLRVAHLTSVHPRFDTRIFRKICLSLARHGCEVHLVVADGKQDALAQGVHVHDVGKPANLLARTLLAPFKVFRRARRLPADIFHFHDPDLIPYGLLLKLSGKRVIYDIHEYYSDTDRYYYVPFYPVRLALSRLYLLMEFITARLVDVCVVVTPHMRDVLPLKRSEVIENYVIPSEFSPAFDQPKEDAVCYVGALNSARRAVDMVDAAERAGTTLYLAGHYYEAALRQGLTRRPGWSRVREEGYIDRRRMQDIFNRSRAGLLLLKPTLGHSHSSCNKLFEYMAAGLPVIASDLPFTRAVLEKHRCGILVDAAGDVAAIADAVRWILSHPAEADAMGRRGRRAVEEEYSWASQETKLLALYGELAG